MARPLAREESALSDWIVLLALVIAVIIVLGVYYVVFTVRPSAPPVRVQQGDQISVDYIGSFQSSGLVFDTSIQSVGADNATYPKAFSFSWKSSWSPLQFTIGDHSVVTGFDQGVRGLSLGQTTTIIVAPALGYGPSTPGAIVLHNIIETVPVRVTMNESAFQKYYGQVALSDTNVTDPVYGWSATVSILNGLVTVTNSPYPSEPIHPYGAWGAVVLSVDDTANNGTGVITVQNHVDPSMVDKVGGKTPDGKTFYLAAVDPSGGTYTVDFDKQVVGRTLVFQVSLVQIISSA